MIHRLFAQIDRIMDINGLDKISTEVVETALRQIGLMSPNIEIKQL